MGRGVGGRQGEGQPDERVLSGGHSNEMNQSSHLVWGRIPLGHCCCVIMDELHFSSLDLSFSVCQAAAKGQLGRSWNPLIRFNSLQGSVNSRLCFCPVALLQSCPSSIAWD